METDFFKIGANMIEDVQMNPECTSIVVNWFIQKSSCVSFVCTHSQRMCSWPLLWPGIEFLNSNLNNTLFICSQIEFLHRNLSTT